jgi:putative sterol carrier protein
MVEFLSAAWIDALDAAARVAVLDTTASITVEQVVRHAPGGEVRYHLLISDGRARVHTGPADTADLRLFADYETAARLQRGELNAQEALAAGCLKVQGRFERLVRVDDALRALENAFAPVRAQTTYRDQPLSR